MLFHLSTCQLYQKVFNCSTASDLADYDYNESQTSCEIKGVKELKPLQYGGFLRYIRNRMQRQSFCPSKITFSDCEINFVPSKIFESCPKITHFDISFSSVNYVNDYVFIGIGNLLVLKMSNNEINQLHDYTFSYGANLLQLDFSWNSLRKITEYAFYGLNKLEVLDLKKNQIEEIDVNSFKMLKSLKKIDLRSNSITVIDSSFFSASSLTSIYLSNNQLKQFLIVSPFEYYLDIIDLSNNFLTNFTQIGFDSKTILLHNNFITNLLIEGHTKELNANNNHISNISFHGEITIEKLNLSKNNISDISFLKSLQSLKELDLSFNDISTINDSSLSLLQNLEQLILGNTNLLPFHFSTFSHQNKLKKFDISYNNLEEVDLDDFISMQALEELYIDGNDLKEIKYLEINNNFPSLTMIGLSNNNWNCSYLTKMRKNIFLNKIQIHIDPNMYARNTTNIGGIGCSDDKDIQEIIKNTIWNNISTPIKHTAKDENSEQLNHKINLLMNELSKLQEKDKILVEKLLDMEKKLSEKSLINNTVIQETENKNDSELIDLIIEEKNRTNTQLAALIEEVQKLSSKANKENRGNSSSGILLLFLVISISSILVVYSIHLYLKKRKIVELSRSRTPILDNTL